MKKQFFENAKKNPTSIYHRPEDILRDRRLNDAERLELLELWRMQECRAGHGQLADQIVLLKDQLTLRGDAGVERRASV